MLKSIDELRGARYRNRWTQFVQWLWIKRNVDAGFRIGVLTEENRKTDDSLPAPALTMSDAVNLFKLLEIRKLVFETKEPYSYWLNKVEEDKWDEFVSDLERRKWTRHWIVRFILSSSAFLIAAFIGGLTGGFAKPIGEFIARLLRR